MQAQSITFQFTDWNERKREREREREQKQPKKTKQNKNHIDFSISLRTSNQSNWAKQNLSPSILNEKWYKAKLPKWMRWQTVKIKRAAVAATPTMCFLSVGALTSILVLFFFCSFFGLFICFDLPRWFVFSWILRNKHQHHHTTFSTLTPSPITHHWVKLIFCESQYNKCDVMKMRNKSVYQSKKKGEEKQNKRMNVSNSGKDRHIIYIQYYTPSQHGERTKSSIVTYRQYAQKCVYTFT